MREGEAAAPGKGGAADASGDARGEPSHARRLLVEQAGQIVAIAALVLDRVLLTAVFYRSWGEADFATWSVLMSLAGLIGLSEFGFAMYFNNAVALAVQRGDKAGAVRAFGVGFTVLSLSAFSGLILLVAFTWAYVATGIGAGRPDGGAQLIGIVAVLALAAALRIPMTVVFALYRAHLRYARFTIVQATADAARIVVIAFAVLMLGTGFTGVAAITLLASCLLQVGYFLARARRDHPEFHFRFQLPTADERGEIGRVSTAYFSQTLSTILLTSVPVILLERTAAASVAAFVVIRTLMGLPRMLLQSVGVVIGYECARQLTGVSGKAAAGVVQATRSIAVASGLLTGVLLALGPEITRIWLGDAGVFVGGYAIAAGLPMVLAAASVISHNILVSINEPYLAAVGRCLQLVLTVLLFLAMPIADGGLRMLVALGIGEILGYAVLSYVAVYRRLPETDAVFHVRMVLTSLAVCAACWLAVGWFAQAVAGSGAAGVSLKLVFAGLLSCCLFVLLGLGGEQRREVLTMLRIRKQGAP